VRSTASDDSARRTRAEQNAESGRRLLTALVDLVAEQGYDATSAAEIGLRAGFSRSMVHARYGTKVALLEELMCTEYEQRILGGIDDTAAGLQREQAIVDQLEQLATDDEPFLKSMFILSFGTVRGSVSVTARITRWLADLEAAIVAALTAGKSDGSVRADIEPTSAARETMMTGFGIAFAWIVLPGTNFHAELARWSARIAADYSPSASLEKRPS
jgi:AcrR family transcriptional regulator